MLQVKHDDDDPDDDLNTRDLAHHEPLACPIVGNSAIPMPPFIVSTTLIPVGKNSLSFLCDGMRCAGSTSPVPPRYFLLLLSIFSSKRAEIETFRLEEWDWEEQLSDLTESRKATTNQDDYESTDHEDASQTEEEEDAASHMRQESPERTPSPDVTVMNTPGSSRRRARLQALATNRRGRQRM